LNNGQTMHEKVLLVALEQASRGRGFCAPNPSVGAVAVKADEVIGSAFHQGAGTPHAEQLLIQELGERARGAVLYVTLEPCNHYGKTPPCAQLVVKAGFKQVIFAYQDPHPVVVKSLSIDYLLANRVLVTHYPMPEIDAFYQSYQHWVTTGLPFVSIKMAQTLDGKIAGIRGERLWLSNEKCADFTHQQRLQSDVLLTTAQTVRLDNPQFDVRLSGYETAKPVAILDRCLTLSGNEKIFSTAHHCHIYYDAAIVPPRERSGCTYHPIEVVNGQLDLHQVLMHLGQLGFHDVWVEAGARLFDALHQADLVDRTYLYMVPRILGEGISYPHALFEKAPVSLNWLPMDDNMIAVLNWRSIVPGV